jgi:hypothetical protein
VVTGAAWLWVAWLMEELALCERPDQAAPPRAADPLQRKRNKGYELRRALGDNAWSS